MPAARPILIVADDAAARASLAGHLSLHAEFDADQAGSAAEAEAKLAAVGGAPRRPPARSGPAGRGRAGPARAAPRAGLQEPEHHAGGGRPRRAGRGERLRGRRERLRGEAPPHGELLARIRAHLRAFDASEDAAFAVGPHVSRPAARLLTDAAGRRKVRLTGKEGAVLRFLCRADGGAVPRQVLSDAVWGHGGAAPVGALDVCVHGLRRKIEPDPSRPRLLVTEGGGYRLETANAADRRTFGEAFRSEGGV